MPKRIEYEGAVHEFPDDFTDADIAKALKGPQAAQQQPAAAPQQSYPEIIGHFGSDVLQGLGAGVLSTIFHGGDLVRRGTEAVVGPEWAAKLGMENKLDKPEVRALITPPSSTPGQLGYGAEKMGEFFIPAGAVGKAAKVVEGATAGMRGAGALNLAARAGLEGAAAGGVAGVQTGGDPNAMREAALTAGGVTAGLGTAAAALPVAAKGLNLLARTQYGKVLNPAMKGTKHISRYETIPGLLERRVTGGSMEGLLDKTQTQVDKWGKAIEDAWSTVPQNTPLKSAPILQAIEDSVADAKVAMPAGDVNLGPIADTMMDHADLMKTVVNKLSTVNPQSGELEITVGNLRKLKTFAQKKAAEAGTYGGKPIADQSLAAIHATVGEAGKDQLAVHYPEVAKLNEQFHFWKNANKVVDETIERRVGQERGLIKTIGNTIGGLAGTAVGNQIGGTAGAIGGTLVGTAVTDMLQRAMTSPGWRTTSAVTKQRLAEALANGNIGGVEFYLRKILAGGGGAQITAPISLQQQEAR
jgi:hypothetical protein